MQQVVLSEPGTFAMTEFTPPTRQPGEALLDIRRIGVCGTDLHAFAGNQPFFSYPRRLGHELGAVILEVDADNPQGLKVGDQVAVEPYVHCGKCKPCLLGRYNCCETLVCLGVHEDGGMCPTFCVSTALLHKSDKLSLDQLALVETLGIGAHAVERAEIQPGEDILIVGAGPIGLAAMQFAAAAGANIHVLELSPSRREFVESLGYTTFSDTPKRLFPLVIDATGNSKAMQNSLLLTDFVGRLVFVGLVNGHIELDDRVLHRREITIKASRNSAGLFPKIIKMIEEGAIDTGPWITHRLQFDQVVNEFQHLRSHQNLVKAMIEVPAV
ncbi:MAG: alcohol dehydrogenase [Blastopirellula sp.]|nr:MAG: alcohol dehydrogenase [Blastopirellula sp.]